jgi:hypothetical protein
LEENRKKMKAEERDKDDDKKKIESGMKNCGGKNGADDKTENHQPMKTQVHSLSESESARPQTVQYSIPKWEISDTRSSFLQRLPVTLLERSVTNRHCIRKQLYMRARGRGYVLIC